MGMCVPKGYGSSGVLVINRLPILAGAHYNGFLILRVIFVLYRVTFLHSNLYDKTVNKRSSKCL